MSDHPVEVQRAVKLLEMRGSGDPHRRLAVERQIKKLPAHVHAAAKAHLAGPSKHAAAAGADGVVTFDDDKITVTDKDRESSQRYRGEAQLAIAAELGRAVKAVEEGHREGYGEFRKWYRKWEKAKESASEEFAKKLLMGIIDVGLDVVFPEGEEFWKLVKVASQIAFKGAEAALESIPKNDIEVFLDSVGNAEEKQIAAGLDVQDKFFETAAAQKAIDSFVFARMDGWDHTEKLPNATLEILKSEGIGGHSSATAAAFAERFLTAHIESVLSSEPETREAMENFGENIEVRAEIDALREEQSLPSVDNREKIWSLEQRLPDMFRDMVDINSSGSENLHVRLHLDRDVCKDIVASRDKDGPFQSSADLKTRKLVDADDLKKVEGQIVCH
jgi:hypothetical protein